MSEIIAEVLQDRNPLRLRSNPRVLKRAVPAYPPKRQKHKNWPQPTKWPEEAVCVAK